MMKEKGKIVHTAIGDGRLDQEGAAIAVVRMDPARSYSGSNALLQKVVRDSDEAAWAELKTRYDYTYQNVAVMMDDLEKETGFLAQINEKLAQGQKLLFKPNLVSAEYFVPFTYGPSTGSTAMTEHAVIASVMRWFHDQAGVSFYQMMVGEAATATSGMAAHYRFIKPSGRPVTTEAVIEGRSDDFWGGYGFYFIRKYLAENADKKGDDPMAGLEEIMAGTYIPPGLAKDKLMVYDLNRICDDTTKGREIPTPMSECFESIVLHKVIVGGDPADAEDRQTYPGCVLINMPKLKIHAQAMMTVAIKNLGIGLYPMEFSRNNDCQWEYATPPGTKCPGFKGFLPHQVWVPELDPVTSIPLKNPDGTYKVHKTGGLTGTMLDIIHAVANQDIFMMHIVDGIEAINRDHTGSGLGVKEPQGLVIAGLNPVATDLFCARYMFSNCDLKTSQKAGLDDGAGGLFPQAVPVPVLKDGSIVTTWGFDCPPSRDTCCERGEQRGLGVRKYYVVGHDDPTSHPLASVGGRLGYIEGDNFTEIVTKALFSDSHSVPWDMQTTFFAYLDAVDQLQGTAYKKSFLDTFDEDGDGVVSYDEKGKKGLYGTTMFLGGLRTSLRAEGNEAETYRAAYALLANGVRMSNPDWNEDGHTITREQAYGSVCGVALMMSFFPNEMPDPHVPGLMWGKGKWPSYAFAYEQYLRQAIFGFKYPQRVMLVSLYGVLCAYVDHTQNDRTFMGSVRGVPNTKGPQIYVEAVRSGRMQPLDFTIYLPPGVGGTELPNVEITTDPAKTFTAVLEGGRLHWPDLRYRDIQNNH
ncbi:MAG: DUF362 domain-containing protein [Deltaproteobacteria bacterium]|nr:DUF362 domain-containing protein [Deltaproteobacteria bacterium]